MTGYSQTIRPDPHCPICHGSGEVYDAVPVPFGSGDCLMPSYCECVEAQADDDATEIVIEQSIEDTGWVVDRWPISQEVPAAVLWAMKRRGM